MGATDLLSYPDPHLFAAPFRLPLGQRLRLAWDTRKILSRRRRQDAGNPTVKLLPLHPRGHRPLLKGDLPLIFLTHNDLRFLRSFLAHYRALGVTRFLCVDDQSDDGTREYLLNEPDVDLFSSNVRYGDARRGRIWRESLLGLYGADRWYLNVDSDEYFIYKDCDTRPVPDLVAALEARAIERCPAPMLDAYPDGPIGAAEFPGTNDLMPWDVAGMLDLSGYRLSRAGRALSVEGGMRERVFGVTLELMKYPLLYWREGYSLGISIHQPAPFHLNFAPVMAGLLHFKFFSDAADQASRAIADKQYFDAASVYARIAEGLATSGGQTFLSPQSFAFTDPTDLVRRGFMADPFARS